MDIDLLAKIIENGSTFGFAMLVWWELRTMRVEMVGILNRLDERVKKA